MDVCPIWWAVNPFSSSLSSYSYWDQRYAEQHRVLYGLHCVSQNIFHQVPFKSNILLSFSGRGVQGIGGGGIMQMIMIIIADISKFIIISLNHF